MNYNKFLAAKIPALEAVDIEHRILNIGIYNIEVSSCGICASGERIETFGKHCLGFGSPSQRAGYIDKTLAVVYECPVCLERQWSHATVTGGYYMYLRFLHRRRYEVDRTPEKSFASSGEIS